MIKKRFSEIIIKAFYKVWEAVKKEKYLKYVLKGGRNSAKSSTVSEIIILLIMMFPVSALVVRKVANTLKESVFEQLKWAIDYLEVGHLFKFTESPMRITYLPRGNSIIFRGADDATKIKSIKLSKFPIAILWIEELAEFKTQDEVSTIENSVIRAELPMGIRYYLFYTYNPPKRKQSWVNKLYESHLINDNTFIHHSTYMDNPYIAKQFTEEAENLKNKDEFKYRWEYLGEPIGSGVVPFNNLVFRTITDKEIESFDNIRQGVDWGYGADPFCFGRMHFDKTRRKLYFIDELYGIKLSNRYVADWIKSKTYNDFPVICDSAEPKSVAELKTYGIRTYSAKKGPGSVEYGEKWLDDLEEIIIDPKRTPNIAREFESIDYETDKDGNLRSKLQDKDNHAIDMTRYAMEKDMQSKTFSFE